MRRRSSPQPQKKPVKSKRINQDIIASRVQVITEEGENLGILSLTEAITQAEEAGMDIVEMGEKDGIVITKMMDYGKYLFREQKKLAVNKVNSKQAEVKTIKLTYRMWEHDRDIRLNQVRKFVEDGHPIKVVLQLRGRENHFAELASGKVKEFIAFLQDIYKTDEAPISKTGNTFSVLLYPKK